MKGGIMLKTKIKELRKHFKLSQVAFGEKIGVSLDVINNLEKGRADPNELVIKTLCSSFNANEHWLKTGKGNMFIESNETLSKKLVHEYNMSTAQ